ncbi:MAG: NmrA family NAD(P)-binding protein [Actinobacteria bacterium]|nr:NmrA family NAD(P)-binding protein [Actinomycetota bacterium]
MTILVTGGTGILGRPTVELLRAAGHDVRILSRSTGGDLSTGAGVTEALEGVGTVLHLATSASTRDVRQTQRLVDAAKAAGVTHVVYISIVGVDTVPYSYYRAKFACEQIIEASGIPFTILRATQFHSFVAMIPRAQRRLPVIFSLNAPDQPIRVEEVAERLVELVAAGPSGLVADIGGPQQLTMREAIAIWQRAAGTRKPVWTIPLGGKMMRAMRAGEHMPGLPGYGRGTFAEYAEHEARP